MAYTDQKDMEPGRDDSDCFYLPADFPGAESLKVGDKLTLKVTGKDEETGEIEVSHDGTESTEDWRSDLHSSMAETEPTEPTESEA